MHRSIEVAKLTRPARLRSLLRSQRSIVSTCPIHAPPEQLLKPGRSLESNEAIGRRRREHEDYVVARELQKARKADDAGSKNNPPPRSTNLPSLRRPASFQGRPTVANEAGPSRSKADGNTPQIKTRKGKEKAVEQGEERTQPTNVELANPLQKTNLASPASQSYQLRNPVGVQLLSPSLHSQIFPESSLPKAPQSLLEISRRHLKDHGLTPEAAGVLPELSFDMPPLQGRNVREHFLSIGKQTAEPYLSKACEFAGTQLPELPSQWDISHAGWTRYNGDGTAEPVDDLGEETLVCFDVETLYKLSPFPVMATAATPSAWYSWLSPTVFEAPPDTATPTQQRWETRVPHHHPHHLIPLFKGSSPRIVIGHNVGYDRARVLEEYELQRTTTRWLDTLSLHVATRGMTSVQRPAWIVHQKNKKAKMRREKADSEAVGFLYDQADAAEDSDLLQSLAAFETESDSLEPADMAETWQDVTSVNSLAEVARLHCGYAVDKSVRNRFGDEDIKHASQLQPELRALLSYCANDVRITHDVFGIVLPLFLKSCPHPASFAGILSMGNSFLPVNESWERYLEAAESKYREMEAGVKRNLTILAEKLRQAGPTEGDPWTSQLDWTPKKARWADPLPDAVPTEIGAIAATELSDVVTSDSAESLKHTSTPRWLVLLRQDSSSVISETSLRQLVPYLLQMSYKGHPVARLENGSWCFRVPEADSAQYSESHALVEFSDLDQDAQLQFDGHQSSYFRIGKMDAARKLKIVGTSVKSIFRSGDLTSPYPEILHQLVEKHAEGLEGDLLKCAEELNMRGPGGAWAGQLDWTPSQPSAALSEGSDPSGSVTRRIAKTKGKESSAVRVTWPKWYHDLTKPDGHGDFPTGTLDLTQKKSVTPLLLRLQWQGFPLVLSTEYKWLYQIPKETVYAEQRSDGAKARSWGEAITDFSKQQDQQLAADDEHFYFRLPHKDGEGKNVGNPLSKAFVKAVESGELSSAVASDGDEASAKAAAEATAMNAICSYWISSRERIMDQLVVYQSPTAGMILPQMITMGAVTRRAVEATWLTASNAKKNRVGSELKAMVRAPPGYALVGADVDSEELWISSVMGDSQFGMHGATAIGWMTLEGTKVAGTDLHSKTAKILGTSRDAAKVFNYSRIYGAGQKHALQLLVQGDPTLSKEEAANRAKSLYAATKGQKTSRARDMPPAAIPSLWHGGSESYLFNTLEAIALSDRPTTPALGCGVTKALTKSYLEGSNAYLPSRINWVVQSSGVDYLHLLIVSMEYLMRKYDIKARYLISVHDEVRYLAEEGDKYRCGLALQIANAWTRALFCYNLGIDNMPQGVAFFSAVDIDHVLRKEVFMTCETPSHPSTIPMGESLDIAGILEKTGSSLGQPIESDIPIEIEDKGAPVRLFPDIEAYSHRRYLDAQSQRQGGSSRAWLNSLPAVVDEKGKPLPAKAADRKKMLESGSLPRINTGRGERGEVPMSLWSEKELDAEVIAETGLRAVGTKKEGSEGTKKEGSEGFRLPRRRVPVLVSV